MILDLAPTAAQLMVVREADNTNTLYWSKPLRGCGYHIRGESGSGSNSSPILKSGIVGESSNSWNHAGTTSWTYRIEVFGIDGTSVFSVGTWHDRYKAIISAVTPNYGAFLSTSSEFFIQILNDTSGGSGSYPIVNSNNITIQYSLNGGSWTNASVTWQGSPVSAWKVAFSGLTSGSVNSYSFRTVNGVYIGAATTTTSYGPNLLTNGTFEGSFSGGVPSGWTRGNDATLTSCSSAQETSNVYLGSNSVKLTQTWVSSTGTNFLYQEATGLTVGQLYRIALADMASTTTGLNAFLCGAIGVPGSYDLGGGYIVNQPVVFTSWRVTAKTGTIPSGYSSIQMRVGVTALSAGTTNYYLDNVYLGKAA